MSILLFVLSFIALFFLFFGGAGELVPLVITLVLLTVVIGLVVRRKRA